MEKADQKPEVKSGYISQDMADQTYADMPIVFQSVIDATWKELSSYPSQTASLADIFPGSKSDWEYKREEVEAIKDSVREMSIYDEELESNFIIHITLPPNFDEKKKYPMFVAGRSDNDMVACYFVRISGVFQDLR